MLTSRKQTANLQSKIIKALEEAPNTKSNYWSEFEVSMMKRFYAIKGAKTLAKVLGKSSTAVYDKAAELGLSRKERS